LRIAFKHSDVFPIVAALDAAVDCHDLYYEGTPLDELYPSREHCRQDSPVLHVSQSQQPRHIFFACESSSRWERGNDRLHEKLTALGVQHQFATDAKAASVMTLLEFVERALIDESRRLF
jgi:S-formylglutathione hydrolase